MMSKTIRNWLIAFGVLSLVLISGYLLLSRSKEVINTSQPTQHTPNYVTIKYRTSQVDIANPRFEYLDTLSSSFVRGAWYDASENYMIINLSSTNYHYCGMPASIWQEFKNANSTGTYYNSNIKGSYDCRENPVPDYE